MASSPAPARAAAGHSRIATTSERNTKGARTRRRRNLIDILYSGASTSRQKRYAAEPAPDMANVPLIDERTANRLEFGLVALLSEPTRSGPAACFDGELAPPVVGRR